MKSPNIRHTLLFIVIIFTMNNAFAQKSDVGFDFGFGKTEPKPMNPLDVLSFNNELQHYLNVDLNYSYTPNSAFFRFKGGFDYSFRDRHSLSLNYIMSIRNK